MDRLLSQLEAGPVMINTEPRRVNVSETALIMRNAADLIKSLYAQLERQASPQEEIVTEDFGEDDD